MKKNVYCMEKKYLKLTPAGQMAVKKITVSGLEKSILERIQKEEGFVLPTHVVHDEHLDVSSITALLQKGWLRETDIGNIAASSVGLSSQPPVSPSPPPSEITPVPEPSVQVPETAPVPRPKIEVSEEEKAKSYENFMKIMGSK